MKENRPSEIVVISGFLGSGKTTLLKRLLDWELDRGISPLVIMSEFGDLDVDGAIIADERLEVMAITGGCICCSNKDELSDAIRNMTGESPGSHIYIETTGLADPAGVLATIVPVIQHASAVIKKVLVVYDASRHDADTLESDAGIIEKQVLTADCILINKCDLVPEGVEGIADELSAANPSAAIHRTVNCDLDMESTVRGVTSCFATDMVAHVDEAEYKSFAFKFGSRLLREPFEKWLRSLPAGVLRVKGLVRFENENGIFEVQATADQYGIKLFPTTRWLDSNLVAITHPMTADTLLAGLRRSVRSDGAT